MDDSVKVFFVMTYLFLIYNHEELYINEIKNNFRNDVEVNEVQLRIIGFIYQQQV